MDADAPARGSPGGSACRGGVFSTGLPIVPGVEVFYNAGTVTRKGGVMRGIVFAVALSTAIWALLFAMWRWG